MALTEGNRIIYASWPDKGFPVTASEAVKVGDLLGIASSKVFPVDSDDGEQGRFVALADADASQAVPCAMGAIIGGFTGGTSAGAVYPGTTAGQYTESADSDSGDTNTIVGYIIDANTIIVLPAVRADSTA